MKHLRLAAALAVAILAGMPLSACATIEGLLGGHSVADTNQSAVTAAEKGLTVAHLAYQAVGVSLQEAAGNGTLRGDNAAKAKDLFDRAGQFLALADQADASANAEGIGAAVAEATALIAEISAMLPK